VPATAASPTVAATIPQVAKHAEIIDLKIKIAELEGDLRRNAVECESLRKQYARVKAAEDAGTPNSKPGEVDRVSAELRKAEQQEKTYGEQLKLHQAKLLLLEQALTPAPTAPIELTPEPSPAATPLPAAGASAPVAVPGAAGLVPGPRYAAPTAVPRVQTLPATPGPLRPTDSVQVRGSAAPVAAPATEERLAVSIVKLLYDGKDFEAWERELQGDLSPQRRAQAIHALAAFGTRGQGRRAAQAILNSMIDFSKFPEDSGSEPVEVRWVAVEALRKLPADETMPLLLEALKNGNADLRRFATTFPNHSPEWIAALLPLLKDPDADVRQETFSALMQTPTDTAELVEALRTALSSDNKDETKWAIGTLATIFTPSNGGMAPPRISLRRKDFLAVMPQLVNLIRNGHAAAFDKRPTWDSGGMGGMGGGMAGPVKFDHVLTRIGPDAVPALEDAAKSAEPEVKARIEKIIAAIRDDEAKKPKPAD
jgi:hypothetical protein